MGIQEIDVQKTVNASASAIFELLDASATWPEWTPIEDFQLVEPAGTDGLGEVRLFRTGRVCVRERIVERVPGRRLSYLLLDGLALSNYVAEIDLSPDGAGTAVRWHTTFTAKMPGTGWLYRRALLKATQGFVDGLARAAAFRASEPPPATAPGQ